MRTSILLLTCAVISAAANPTLTNHKRIDDPFDNVKSLIDSIPTKVDNHLAKATSFYAKATKSVQDDDASGATSGANALIVRGPLVGMFALAVFMF